MQAALFGEVVHADLVVVIAWILLWLCGVFMERWLASGGIFVELLLARSCLSWIMRLTVMESKIEVTDCAMLNCNKIFCTFLIHSDRQ